MTADESSILEKVVVRAWEDNEFKEELLKNPNVVIEEETGYKIPEGLEIQVLEETVKTRYLVLPKRDTSFSEDGETEQIGIDIPLSEVITKAVEDSSFRESLISNPNTVIEEELGLKLPEGVEIRVLEHQDNVSYFVIPVSPEWEEDEEELVTEGWKVKKVFKDVKNITKVINSTISITVCIGNRC